MIISLNQLFIILFFFFNDTATTEIYTLSLHDALPIPYPWVVSLASPHTFHTADDPASRSRERAGTRAAKLPTIPSSRVTVPPSDRTRSSAVEDAGAASRTITWRLEAGDCCAARSRPGSVLAAAARSPHEMGCAANEAETASAIATATPRTTVANRTVSRTPPAAGIAVSPVICFRSLCSSWNPELGLHATLSVVHYPKPVNRRKGHTEAEGGGFPAGPNGLVRSPTGSPSVPRRLRGGHLRPRGPAKPPRQSRSHTLWGVPAPADSGRTGAAPGPVPPARAWRP